MSTRAIVEALITAWLAATALQGAAGLVLVHRRRVRRYLDHVPTHYPGAVPPHPKWTAWAILDRLDGAREIARWRRRIATAPDGQRWGFVDLPTQYDKYYGRTFEETGALNVTEIMREGRRRRGA